MMRPGPLLSLQRKPDGFPLSPKGQNPRREIRHLSGTIHATRNIRDKRITSSNSMKNMMTGLRAMRDGSQLVGWGMAPGKNIPSKALVRLQPDAEFWLRRGRQEIRTGTDTIIPQITADVLSISPDLVDARLGDTNYPEAPISAGSMSTANVGPPLSRPPLQARQNLSWGPVHPYILPTLKKWNSKAEKYF